MWVVEGRRRLRREDEFVGVKFVKYKGVTSTVVDNVLGGKLCGGSRVVISGLARRKDGQDERGLKIIAALSGRRIMGGAGLIFLTIGPRFCRRILGRMGNRLAPRRAIMNVTPKGALT